MPNYIKFTNNGADKQTNCWRIFFQYLTGETQPQLDAFHLRFYRLLEAEKLLNRQGRLPSSVLDPHYLNDCCA
jgi:hypothetical protein